MIVAAIPLEPAARIVRMDPALAAPLRQRLAGIDAEIVQRAVAPVAGELGAREPVAGNSLRQSVMYLPPKTPSAQHLRRRQFGPEVGIEIAAAGADQHIAIAALHLVVDGDASFFHSGSFCGVFHVLPRCGIRI